MEINKIYCMDCIEGMKKLEDNSVDSIVTDPPYGLGFMGKEWDTYDKSQFGLKGNEGENDLKVKKNFKALPRYRSDNSFYDFSYAWSKEAFRVLKPGGYLLSFGGTRTYHRMACAIEDAGFEIRDQIQWVYGSGFPKSLNIGKALQKKGITNEEYNKYGTALKPANEPICVARKPLGEKTVAENVLKWGTGGINIDECRIGYLNEKDKKDAISIRPETSNSKGFQTYSENEHSDNFSRGIERNNLTGRFPANVIHDGSDEVVSLFPNENGSAARFFYCAKASKSERNEGLDNTEETINCDRNPDCYSADVPFNRSANPKKNIHPTVKPLKLMEYLVKLVTPKGGVCLDPFMGSGTTAVACKKNGFKYLGFDMTKEYVDIAEARIANVVKQEKI